MNALDRFLLSLPESTRGWTCPWFHWIVWWGTLAVLAGLLAQSTAGWVAVAVGGTLLVLTIAERRDGARCAR